MAWYNWSKTASINSNADPSINWASGMSASSVEPSGRAMMARTAEWRDDVSGTITTGGSLNAYTVASNQVFDTLAHMNGAMIAFVPHTTNGAIVTLNVDGLGAKPLRSSPSIEIGAGVLVQGTPYVVTYNNSDAAFYLQNFFGNPFNIPIGGLMPYLGSTAPNANFVLPFGQAISRTTYATLFALVSTTFGAGDGTTTFGVPDLRGRVIPGLDNMGGSAASRIGTVVTDSGTIVGTTIGSAGGSATHVQTLGELAAHGHPIADHFHGIPHSKTSNTTHNHTDSTVSADGPNPSDGGDTASNTNSTSLSAQSNGGSAAMAWLQPSLILPYILRVI